MRRPLSNDDDDDDDDDDLFADLLLDSEEEDQKDKHKQTKPKLKLIDSISKTQPTNNDNIDNGKIYVLVSHVWYTLGLSDYRDSTDYRDSLGLFSIVIVDCLTI